MEEKNININIHNNNNNESNKTHNSALSKKDATIQKKQFNYRYIIVPVILALIAALTQIFIHNKNTKKEATTQCAILHDLLKKKQAELNSLLISTNNANYKDFALDSVIIEQSIYDILTQINANKCPD